MPNITLYYMYKLGAVGEIFLWGGVEALHLLSNFACLRKSIEFW